MAQRNDSWRGGGTGRGAYVLAAQTATQVPLTLDLAAEATANGFLVRNSVGTTLFAVSPEGNITIAGSISAVISETLTGNVSLTGTLSVTGTSTLTGAVATGASLSVGTNLTVSGITSAPAMHLRVRTAAPANVGSNGILYTQAISGLTELFYVDSSGTTVQITSAGVVPADVFREDDLYMGFGNVVATPDIRLGWNTTQTVDAFFLGLSDTQNTFIIAENGDRAFDFAHGAQTNPTVFLQSAGQSSTEFSAWNAGKIAFGFGIAAVATDYFVGRNADGTNLMQLNVPTGASFELSVNDAVQMTLSATAVNFQDNSITTTGGGSLTGTWSDLGTVTTVDINGGTIDGTTIGATSATTGVFTTLVGSTAGNVLTLTNSTDGVSSQVAILQGDRATMADNDEAYLTLRLSNDGGTQTEFARITWVAIDVNVATSEDGRLDFAVRTTGVLANELQLDGLALSPSSDGGIALGTTSLGYNGLHLNTGTAINWENSDVTITHAANTLAFAGATAAAGGYTFDQVIAITDVGMASTNEELLNLTGTITTSGAGENGAGITLALTNTNTVNANTAYGLNILVNDTSALANTVYGSYVISRFTGSVAAGTTNFYGGYYSVDAAGIPGGLSANAYGLYVTNTLTTASGAGTLNAYGLYIANGTSNTNATSTKTGLYVESQTGADANYSAIFAGGRVLIGVNTALTIVSAIPQFQIEGIDGSIANMSITRNSANSAPPIFNFVKTDGATNNDNTIVVSGDELGKINFAGADGVDKNSIGARISAFVDGTPGVGDMPGRLVFFTTADGAGTSTERMRITAAGRIGIGTTTPGTISSDALVEISSNSSNFLTITAHGTSQVPGIRIIHSRGTLASPTATQSADTLFSITGRGYGATTYSTSGRGGINLIAAENFTDSAQGTILQLVTTAIGATTGTERLRIDSAGVVGTGAAAFANVTTAGTIVATGGFAVGDVLNSWIDDSTHGTASTAMLIGNQTITVSSDVRIKENITDTRVNALELLSQLRVVDFNWKENFVAHEAYNKRGTFTGLIAQEAVGIVPTIFNTQGGGECSLCLKGVECSEHLPWHVQYEYLVPTVVKGIQELSAEIIELKKEVAELKKK